MALALLNGYFSFCLGIPMKVLLAFPRILLSQSMSMFSSFKGMFPADVQIIVPKEGTEEELVQLGMDVDMIVCVTLSEKVALAAKKLKLVQKIGAGVDGVPFDVLREEVAVANTSGANPTPLAEGAVALVLALAKHIVRRHNLFPQGDDTTRVGVELRGKNAGIIGIGHVGMEVARLLKAFEMKIYATKRDPKDTSRLKFIPDFLGGPSDLDYVFRESDFLVITAPLTPETRGMIGERELHLMKHTAYIVNVGRGQIIQEEPLYRALKEGWIAGAGLDVWWSEPWWNPSAKYSQTQPYEFWKLANVIATPHNIALTDAGMDAELQLAAENIRRVSEGKPAINQVNKELQY
jgi:phosphoglycerate dehydrogenase-like enzyme